MPVLILAIAAAAAAGVDRVRPTRRTLAATGVVAIAAIAFGPGLPARPAQRRLRAPGTRARPTGGRSPTTSTPRDPPSRILELPGINFAAYDWGNTVEPILPGLVDRPTSGAGGPPAGGAGTTDLLGALDRRLQHDTLDPTALAPVARLLGIGDIVVRGDLDTARFGLPDPAALVTRYLSDPPEGFTIAGTYGGTPGQPALLRLRLDDPDPRLRAESAPPRPPRR